MALEETGVSFVTEGEDAFQSSLDSAGNAVNGFGDIVGNISGGVADAFGEIITGALRRVGEFAIETLASMGQAVIDFGKDSFEGALEAEQGIARLTGAIRRAGDASPITEERALELADAYKELAGGSDDAVIAAQAVLLKFQSIDEDAFEPALNTALDLAAILGTDVASAAESLGRALEDPERATRLLKSAGVVLSDQEKEQIKLWTESGDAASAQAFILDKLSKASAGAAQDLANTTGGQIDIFKESIADAGETIAAAFLPILQDLFDNYLKPLLPVIEEIADAFSVFIEVLSEGDIGGAFDALMEFDAVRDIFAAFGLSADDVRGVGTVIEELIPKVVDFFTVQLPAHIATGTAAIQPIIDGFDNLKAAIIDSWPEIKITLEEMGKSIVEVFTNVSPEIISNVGGTLDQLAKFWRDHGDTVLKIVEVLWNGIVLTIGGALTLASGAIESGLIYINGVFDAFSKLLKGDWEGFFTSLTLAASLAALNILGAFDVFFESILKLMGTNLETFRQQWADNWEMLGVILDYVMGNIETTIASTFRNVVDAIRGVIVSAFNAILEYKGMFEEAAVQLMAGIRDGIWRGLGWVLDAARGVADAAVREMQSILGISSPSEVMIRAVGMPISEGIAQGIMNGAGMVSKAFSDVVSPIMSPSQMGNAASSSNYSNSTSWNLNVNSSQSSQGVASDFGIMQAMAG